MTTSDDAQSLRIESLPNLRQQVAGRIKEAIEVGRFPPGMRLIERELCDLMGVSRTSVREALRELESSGLVVSQPNRGPTVAVMTAEMAKSIYEVRAMLEGLAARLFARHATRADIGALKLSVERLALTHDSSSTAAALVAGKTDFYRILLAAAGNPIVTDILSTIYTRLGLIRHTALSDPERARQAIAELRELATALELRDEEAAWRICQLHVQNAAAAALEIVQAKQVENERVSALQRVKV